jgi:mono/diheme cytochrome c family protein
MRPQRLIVVIAVVAAPLLLGSSSLAGPTAPAGQRAVTIAVTATDSSLKLSAKSAPAGKVTFSVKNAGKKDHNFQIAGKKTAILKPGRSAKLAVTFSKTGPYTYTSTVAGDAKKGLKGTFTVKAAPSTGGGNVAAGKTVFVSNGCGACHTFKAAGTTGTVGPNLDRSTASRATIVDRITNGKGTMQPYSSVLSSQQIQDVADFVLQSRAG